MKPLFLLLFTLITSALTAQPEANYDETKVPKFSVPDPLVTFGGEAITDSQQWEEKRKLEIYQFFEKQIYGKVPALLDEYSFKVIEQDNNALGGKAQRKQIAVGIKKNNRSLNFNILLYLPIGNENAPVFLGYNFHGNHTVTDDPNVIITEAWNENNEDLKIRNNKATEASRGVRMNRWAIDKMLDKGYGIATVYYGEIDPDKNDFSDGLHSLFYEEGQTKPKTNEWGSIAAWAYGLSRAMDYLENDTNISNVIVFGHSRLGKAALWAGATDLRFAGVIGNDSGCGGAALSKRKFGETIGQINTSFPHWFSESFKKYSNKEEMLPVDQHELLALIAPRPLYVASAVEDEWADPKGEFLSAQYATKVYELYDKKGISSTDVQEVNHPIKQTLAYHMRSGKHDVTDYDWDQYIAWAETFAK
ncbi:glucuronyl esterase domain-containing protein [Zobellia nedashkovskayae]|uniref:glucuronyl esterase domain-containing protein n=1 Tax=Zobellia nedashkovskayae TaxID=2779510 RepID=UPI00293BA7CA|nr:acetylxylan esterase [Zobellia nedashkovskayae]